MLAEQLLINTAFTKILDISGLVTKTAFITKIGEVENKIPDVNRLANETAFNKSPEVSGLVTNTVFNIKIGEIEKKDFLFMLNKLLLLNLIDVLVKYSKQY